MRIMVFGDAAGGKSVFSTKLGRKLDIPVVHLDKASAEIGRGKRKEIAGFIRNEADKESWIIDGNAFSKDKDYRIKRADLVIVFAATPYVAFARHLFRSLKIKLGHEERVGGGTPRFDLRYMTPHIFRFPRRRRDAIETAQRMEKNLVFIKNYKQANEFLASFNDKI